MKKNSTKNRLKRAAILASLIFGSLVLTACDNGNGNGNGNVYIPTESDYSIVINNINNAIDSYKEGEFAEVDVEGNYNDDTIVVKNLDRVFPSKKEYKNTISPSGIFYEIENVKYVDLKSYNVNKNNTQGQTEDGYNDHKNKIDDAIYLIDNAKILDGLTNDAKAYFSQKETKIKSDIKEEIYKYNPILKDEYDSTIDFSKLYLKISDLGYFENLMNNKENNTYEPIIGDVNNPEVKVIKKNGRTAIDFTGSNTAIKIDFSNENPDGDMEVSSYYRGGIIYKTNNIEFVNNGNTNLLYNIKLSDFDNKTKEEKTILNALENTNKFKGLYLSIDANEANTSKNIYKTDIDKSFKKYYDELDSTARLTIPNVAFKYDAKDALIENGIQETMFNSDNSYNTNAHQIDAEFASLLLSQDVFVKNVVIDDTKAWPNERKSGLGGTLINSVVKTSMESVEELKVKGLVRFEEKSPKALSGNEYSKVIFAENTWNDNITENSTNLPAVDVSSLADKQKNIHVPYGYYSQNMINEFKSTQAGVSSLYFGTGYYRGTNNDYTNASRETYGNNGTTPTDIEDINTRINIPFDTNGPLSRANNIKLTPMQRLLLDNQNTIG